MPRPLKVFRAHLGFYDTVVAAPSKKAALAAWGVRGGEPGHRFAEATNDAEAVKAALAQPGVVLRRLFGSTVSFEVHADFSKPPRVEKSPIDKAARVKAKTEKKEAAKAERQRARDAERERRAREAAEARAATAAAAEERRRAKESAAAELAQIEAEERRLRERRGALRRKLRGR